MTDHRVTPIVAAADGSALRNPTGPAGWCWYVHDGCWSAGGWPVGTNNVAELTAVLELLRATRDLGRPLTIESDSQYTINCLTKWIHGWKRKGWRTAAGEPVKNAELIREIDAELRGRAVTFLWVKGHNGHPRQESADVRARAVAEALRDRRAPATGPGWVEH